MNKNNLSLKHEQEFNWLAVHTASTSDDTVYIQMYLVMMTAEESDMMSE